MLRFFADERATALAQDLLCSFGASRRIRPFTFLHDRLTPYRAAAHTQMEPDQRSRTRSEPGTNIHEDRDRCAILRSCYSRSFWGARATTAFRAQRDNTVLACPLMRLLVWGDRKINFLKHLTINIASAEKAKGPQRFF